MNVIEWLLVIDISVNLSMLAAIVAGVCVMTGLLNRMNATLERLAAVLDKMNNRN